MKKTFTFLAAMAIFATSFAQWKDDGDRGPKFDNRGGAYFNSSALVINAFTERRFTVMVDNMQYQLNSGYGNRYDNTINIGAMAPGKHSIRVFETKANFWGRQKQVDVYCASMFFKPGVETTLNVNNYAQVSVTEKPIFQRNSYGYDRDDKRRDDDRKRDDDHSGWHH
jgi:hypothetical protein